jgi:hypothetical protein
LTGRAFERQPGGTVVWALAIWVVTTLSPIPSDISPSPAKRKNPARLIGLLHIVV